MELLYALFFGFLSAFVGIIPPGLINMTAAKISRKEGKQNALGFVFGAVLVIAFQVFFAVFFAKIINSRPEINLILRKIGFAIFLFLSLYFLVFAKAKPRKSKKIKKKSGTKRFFLGMLLSVLNFFPIPYYVFVAITLASYHLFSFEIIGIFSFVLGAVLGSFLVFYLYTLFFNRIENPNNFILKNNNTIIGFITAFIALISLIRILHN